jgi:hypothetical protein
MEAAARLPRRCLQARAADGSGQRLAGGAQQRAGHADGGRRMRSALGRSASC